MGILNEHIFKTVFRKYNFFSAFKLSGYLTLVDKNGKPVVFDINGDKHIFTFNKNHKGINIGKNKKDFSFYEKLFILGLLNSDFKWKNLISYEFRKLLLNFRAIEPRNFSIKVEDGESKCFICNNNNFTEAKLNLINI